MGIPKSPPQRYIPSRQLIKGSDINDLSDLLYSFQAILAAGVAQVDAALLNAANVEILTGSANNAGGKLPPTFPGLIINVLNNSANTTLIYPTGATDVIQSGATGYAASAASVSMATLVSATFVCIKLGFWQMSKNGGP